MKILSAKLLPYSLSLYVLLHYITLFYPNEKLTFLLSAMGILTVLFAGFRLKIRSFALPLFLLTSAVSIQLFTDGSVFELFVEGIKEMRSLIALLIIVPVISWILQEEPYIEEIMNAAHHLLETSRKFYFGIMVVNQIIAYFLLFGSISMMYQFIDEFLKEKKGEAWEYFKSTALLRSFSLTTLWVVSIPSFAFAVDHLSASLGLAILQGFFISTLGMLIGVLYASRKEKKSGVDITSGIKIELDKLAKKSKGEKKWNYHVREFIVLFISLFGTVFLVQMVMDWELLLIIPPIVMLWTCSYFLLKKRLFSLSKRSRDYFVKEIPYKTLQFTLLLSAGVLIYAVNHSGLGDYMVEALFYIEESVPLVNFLAILPFTVILLGFFGLGPLTVIVLVAGILENVSLPYPPELVVLSMTSGSVVSVLISPLILPVIILSASNGLGVIKNGFSYNSGFAIAFYFLVQTYIQAVVYIIN